MGANWKVRRGFSTAEWGVLSASQPSWGSRVNCIFFFLHFLLNHTWKHKTSPGLKKEIHQCFVSWVLHLFFSLWQACPIIFIILEEANMNWNISFSLYFFFFLFSFPFTQAGTQISLADLPFSNEIFTLWYNLLPSKQIPCKKNEEETEDSVFQPSQPLVDSVDLVSQVLLRHLGLQSIWN